VDQLAETIEISFERLDVGLGKPGHGLARVTGSARQGAVLGIGRRLLAPVDQEAERTILIEARRCIPLHQSLPDEQAMRIQALALALAICDAADLELGEVAVYTSGVAHESIVATVAQWRTARDAIRLRLQEDALACPPGVQDVDGADPQRALEVIRMTASHAPGFAAIVLSPQPEALDVLLEAMPMWGRLVIGSASSAPATIDFYNNIHRKGVRMVSVPSSARFIFEAPARADRTTLIERAIRILTCEDLAAACLANVT
jgi:hypothetical protein